MKFSSVPHDEIRGGVRGVPAFCLSVICYHSLIGDRYACSSKFQVPATNYFLWIWMWFITSWTAVNGSFSDTPLAIPDTSVQIWVCTKFNLYSILNRIWIGLVLFLIGLSKNNQGNQTFVGRNEKIGCEKEMHHAAQCILKSVSLLQQYAQYRLLSACVMLLGRRWALREGIFFLEWERASTVTYLLCSWTLDHLYKVILLSD